MNFLNRLRYFLAIRRLHKLRLRFFMTANDLQSSIDKKWLHSEMIGYIEHLSTISIDIMDALSLAERYDTAVYTDESRFDGDMFWRKLRGDFSEILTSITTSLESYISNLEASIEDLATDTSSHPTLPMDTLRHMHQIESESIRTDIIDCLNILYEIQRRI